MTKRVKAIEVFFFRMRPTPLWFWEWRRPMTLADWGISL
jgi:hypothetical protein